MFQVICFCKKHREMNTYWPGPLEWCEKVKAMYPGYRVIVYIG